MVKYVMGLLLLSCSVFSQTTLLDDISLLDTYRNSQLMNGADSAKYQNQSFMIRSTSAIQQLFAEPLKDSSPLQNITFRHTIHYNDVMPLGYNQGTLYPAIGFQRRSSLGVHLSWKFLDVNLQPEWVIAENSPPPVFVGNPQDGNYITRIFFIINNQVDYYNRFGETPLNTFFPGQSRVAFQVKNIATGISTENNWWGAGFKNSLMMTNEASGFLHYFLQTRKPVLTPIGSFEGKGLIGMLENPSMYSPEDKYFRPLWAGGIEKKNKSARMLKAFIVNWQPKWVPNLYLGYSLARQTYFTNEEPQPGKEYIPNPKMDQGAFIFRFALPKDHAEFYGEFGQPDKFVGPASFFGDSTKTGFIIGGRKLFPLNKRNKSVIRLDIEFAQLQLMDPALVIKATAGEPNRYSWYTSTEIRQGYTQNAKLLGATIGPGSNSQTINLSWHKGHNLIRLHAERLARNNDFYLYQYYATGYTNRYWVNLMMGAEAQVEVGKHLLLGGSIFQTIVNNYMWVRLEDGSGWSDSSSKSDYTNLQWQFSLKYSLHGSR